MPEFAETPPASTVEIFSKDQVDIPYKEYRLNNGLRLVVHEDHKAPIVAVNVWYHVGSKNERPGKSGFAHLFEHLMFNGSEHFNDDYFQAMAKIGAVHTVGPLMKHLHDALPPQRQGRWTNTSAELAEEIRHLVGAGDVVMVKGSLSTKMAVIVDAITNLGQAIDKK